VALVEKAPDAERWPIISCQRHYIPMSNILLKILETVKIFICQR